MKTSLFLGTALTALLVTGIASAEGTKIHYVTEEDVLEAENEVPPVTDGTDSTVTATAAFTYDTETGKLCGHINPSTATFEASAAHIHAGEKGKNGDVIVTLSQDGFTGNLEVNLTVPTDKKALVTGDLYVNVHTDAHPNGALRAQLSVDDDPDAPDECATDAGAPVTTTTPDSGTPTATSDAGTSGTATTTADDGGCNTSGSNGGNALALLAGLGVVVAAASRKRKKA